MVMEPIAGYGEFEDIGEDEREAFRIANPSQATWALRKLGYYRSRQSEVDGVFTSELQRLNEWHDTERAKHDRDVEFFEGLLEAWHREVLEADPKRKTISLPGGSLEARQNPDSVVVDDPDKFFSWALEDKRDWVRVKYEPEKAAIKKAGGVVPETGEIAPGVSVIPGELRWKAVTE
jgi:hypothetical protein